MGVLNIFSFKVNLLTALIMTFFIGMVFSQEGPTAVHIQAMKKLDFMVGRWQGEGWQMTRSGQKESSSVEEKIQLKLEGLVLMLEGLAGKKVDPLSGEEIVVHNALGLLSWDPVNEAYRVQSHLSNGRSTTAEAAFTEDGAFQWWFKTPAGTIRYTIRLNNPDQWHEVGHFSPDDQNWRQFFEMTLNRVNPE